METRTMRFAVLFCLALALAGCGNPAVRHADGASADMKVELKIDGAKGIGLYTEADIKHLYLKAFQVDGNGAYHVLPNLTADPDTILIDGGICTEFRKTGDLTYSGRLRLDPAMIGVRFVVWAVSYKFYDCLLMEREAQSRLDAAILAGDEGAASIARADLSSIASIGEISGWQAIYHAQADRNWTEMNSLSLNIMAGGFDTGDTGPAGGVIIAKLAGGVEVDSLPKDISTRLEMPAGEQPVDYYVELAPSDCGIVLAYDDAAAAGSASSINGFSDWMAPNEYGLQQAMLRLRKGAALFDDNVYYWPGYCYSDPRAIRIDYPSGAVESAILPRADKHKLRLYRIMFSAYGSDKALPRTARVPGMPDPAANAMTRY